MANYFPALVIKHRNDVFMTGGVIGTTMAIPTPGAGGVLDGDFWAVPITDYGLFSGFNFLPAKATDIVPPAPGAFHVFRLYQRSEDDVWYVRGTTTNDGNSPALPGYIQASAAYECCAVTPVNLPTTIPAIAPCYYMCDWDANKQYFAMIGLPTLTGTAPRYYPYGYYNGTALTSAASTGYATTAALLAFLNAGTWATVGTWTFTNNVLKVTQTSGTGTNTLCAAVIAISPSA